MLVLAPHHNLYIRRAFHGIAMDKTFHVEFSEQYVRVEAFVRKEFGADACRTILQTSLAIRETPQTGEQETPHGVY